MIRLIKKESQTLADSVPDGCLHGHMQGFDYKQMEKGRGRKSALIWERKEGLCIEYKVK